MLMGVVMGIIMGGGSMRLMRIILRNLSRLNLSRSRTWDPLIMLTIAKR